MAAAFEAANSEGKLPNKTETMIWKPRKGRTKQSMSQILKLVHYLRNLLKAFWCCMGNASLLTALNYFHVDICVCLDTWVINQYNFFLKPELFSFNTYRWIWWNKTAVSFALVYRVIFQQENPHLRWCCGTRLCPLFPSIWNVKQPCSDITYIGNCMYYNNISSHKVHFCTSLNYCVLNT